MNKSDYLTEQNLYLFLKQVFLNCAIIQQYNLDGTRYKFDYFIPDLKLAIEYDGPRHYTSPQQIINDENKDFISDQQNIKVLRIPYFVQLDVKTINTLFKSYKISVTENFNDFPHGFISKKVILPAEFCVAGYYRYIDDLNHTYAFLKNEIEKSLYNRHENRKDTRLVIPKLG